MEKKNDNHNSQSSRAAGNLSGHESKGRTGVLPPPYQPKAANSEEIESETTSSAEPTQLISSGASEDSGGNDAGGSDNGSSSSDNPNNSKNKTGLPDKLKGGVEKLSGLSMNDVKVHYNSSKPATMNAHAYAQGTDIHLASGQEKHLPHEAWHVVQQKQGKVKPTTQLKGIDVNDSPGLEKEATVMGEKAVKYAPTAGNDEGSAVSDKTISGPSIAQMAFTWGEGWTGSQSLWEKVSWSAQNAAQDALNLQQTALNDKLRTLTDKVSEIKSHQYFEKLDQNAESTDGENIEDYKKRVVPIQEFADKWNAEGEEATPLNQSDTAVVEEMEIHQTNVEGILKGFSAFDAAAAEQLGKEKEKLAGLKTRLQGIEDLTKDGNTGLKGFAKFKTGLSRDSLTGASEVKSLTKETQKYEDTFNSRRAELQKRAVDRAERARIANEEKDAKEKEEKLINEKIARISEKVGKGHLQKWETLFDSNFDLIDKATSLTGSGMTVNQLYQRMVDSGVKSAQQIDDFASLCNGMQNELTSVIKTLSSGQDISYLAKIWNNIGQEEASVGSLKDILGRVDSTENLALEQFTRTFSLPEINAMLDQGTGALTKIQNLLNEDDITEEGITALLASPAADKVLSLLNMLPNTTELLNLANTAGDLTEVEILVKDLVKNPAALAKAKEISKQKDPTMAHLHANNDIATARGLKLSNNSIMGTIAPSALEEVELEHVKKTLAYVNNGGVAPTLSHASGAKFGEVWENWHGKCPGIRNAAGYKEYYVEKDPVDPRFHGSRRLIKKDDTGHIYYTNDHYETIKRFLV